MIPSSLLGLAFFIALLAPGLAFVLRHERVVPAQAYSAFRETLRVVFVSVACLVITAVVAAGIRWLSPAGTPNMYELVQSPGHYGRTHYVQLAWWALVLLVIATGLGAIAADPRVVRGSRRVAASKVARWLTGSTKTDIDQISAWYRVMHMFDGQGVGPILIAAQMDNGTVVEGRMFRFNVGTVEDANRDILLSAPIHLTYPNGDRIAYEAQFTVISAAHIVRLDVTHMPPGSDLEANGDATTPDAAVSSVQPVTSA